MIEIGSLYLDITQDNFSGSAQYSIGCKFGRSGTMAQAKITRRWRRLLVLGLFSGASLIGGVGVAAPLMRSGVPASSLPGAFFDGGGTTVLIVDPLDGPVSPASLDDRTVLDELAVDIAEVPYQIEGTTQRGTGLGAPLLHDGDPATAQELASERREVTLDLGEVRPVSAVRWQQLGAAPVVVQRSLLGGVWETVERVKEPTPGAWQAATVDWPARYVRLRFPQGADADAATLTEVEVYGPPEEDEPSRSDSRASQAQATDRGGRQRDRADQVRSPRSPRPAADEGRLPTPEPTVDEPPSEGRSEVTTEDCGDGTGNCRIEIDVSAGTATCNEAGSDGNRAVGRNASAGNGGTCSKSASGGSVDLGEINP